MKKLIICLLLILATAAHALQARDIINNAMDSYNAGDYPEALRYFNSVLDERLDGVVKDKELNYKLNYYAGYSARACGDYAKAYAYLRTALILAQEMNIEDQLPVLNTLIAEVQKEQGEYSSAVSYYESALKLVKKDSAEEATLWYFVAETYREAKDYAESLEASSKAYALASKHKLTKLEVICLTSRGEVYNETGDYSAAIKTFTQALTIARNAQLPLEMANIHLGSALVYQALEKNDLARQHLDEALKLYVLCADASNLHLITDRLISLPNCTNSQALRAIENYESYVETYSGINDQESALLMLLLIGHHQRITGKSGDAVTTFSQTISIAMQYGFADEAAKGAVLLADIYYESEDFKKTLDVLNEAQQYQAVQNPPAYLAEIFAKKGELYERSEKWADALKNYQKAADSAMTDEKESIYTKAVERISSK